MKNFLIALVVVGVAGGAYYLWQGNAPTPAGNADGVAPESAMPAPGMEGTPEMIVEGVAPAPAPSPASSAGAPMTATVTYDGTKFSPSQVTIKQGGTVTWVNASGEQMWVASDVHPSHTTYSGTSRGEHCPDPENEAFDQCAGGGDYSFTFDKLGTWRYHDHLTSSATGRVEVVE